MRSSDAIRNMMHGANAKKVCSKKNVKPNRPWWQIKVPEQLPGSDVFSTCCVWLASLREAASQVAWSSGSAMVVEIVASKVGSMNVSCSC